MDSGEAINQQIGKISPDVIVMDLAMQAIRRVNAGESYVE